MRSASRLALLLVAVALAACRGAAAVDLGVRETAGVARGTSSATASPEPSPAATPRPSAVDAAAPDPSASTEEATEPGRVSFLALGDMLLSRNVARAMAAAGDASWPFRGVNGLLDSVDFAFANLEAPLPGEGRLDPDMLQEVARLGFGVLSLANNHAMDGGIEGLTRTVELLRQAGIATSGVGASSEEAWRPALIRRAGITIAFLAASYTSVNSSRAPWRSEIARIQDVITARQAIRAAHSQADFVVAAMHAGTEYVRHPAEEQRRFAHLAVDAGADLVIGTHPHVVQPVERYRGVWIFYSLGNFLFDQTQPDAVKQSAAVRVTVTRAGERVALERLEVLPLTNDDMVSPGLADDKAAAKTLRRMGLAEPSLVP